MYRKIKCYWGNNTKTNYLFPLYIDKKIFKIEIIQQYNMVRIRDYF